MGNKLITENKIEYTLPFRFINEEGKWYFELLNNADKKFTSEDMRKAFLNGCQNMTDYVEGESDSEDYDIYEEANKYIQSLTKEEYFCELEKYDTRIDDSGKMAFDLPFKPKITNNSVKVIKIWK